MIMKRPNAAAVVSALLLTICFLQSCNKNSNADLRDLLNTVPSEAGVVASVNVRQMAEKAGLKIKDDELTVPASVLEGIADPKVKEAFGRITDGKSGVEMNTIVVFTQGYYSYATGLLNDPEAFKKSVEEASKGARFVKNGEVEICKNIAVKANQFWIGDVESAVDPNTIKGFTALSEKQSFLSNGYAERLLEMDHDLEMVADINGLFSRIGDMKKMALWRMAAGALFADASYLTLEADFEKGEFEMSSKVLDSKMNPAKYLLPAEKISRKTLESLKGSGDLVVALSIPQKLIETFGRLGASFGGSIDNYLAPLKCIDGTVAFIVSGENNAHPSVEGVIDTNGESETSLKGMLSTFGISARNEGKRIYLSSAEPCTGTLTAGDAAGEFKDAVFAVACGPETLGKMKPELQRHISRVYILIKPEKGSIELELKVAGTDRKENFLKSLYTK